MKTPTILLIAVLLFIFYVFYLTTEDCKSKGGTYVARANICVNNNYLIK